MDKVDKTTFASEAFKKLFDEHISDKSAEDRDTIVFPEISGKLANPLRILLQKIIHNNPYHRILTPENFDGFDPVREYMNVLDYGNDRSRSTCIFINNKVIWIDNFDQSNWKHDSRGRLHGRHGKVVDGCIKLQCAPGCNTGLPFPTYPFIYPGPNDYIQGKANYPITYSDKFYHEFKKCCSENSFECNLFARWSNFGQRPQFTELCQQIEGASVAGDRSAIHEEYMMCLARSKFCMAARGNGKWSHREMEICSVGSPLISTDNGGVMWRPFLADTHYIKVTLENFLEVYKYYHEHYDEALVIAERGKQYFDLNHRQPGVQLIFKEIVDTILERLPWNQV